MSQSVTKMKVNFNKIFCVPLYKNQQMCALFFTKDLCSVMPGSSSIATAWRCQLAVKGNQI